MDEWFAGRMDGGLFCLIGLFFVGLFLFAC